MCETRGQRKSPVWAAVLLFPLCQGFFCAQASEGNSMFGLIYIGHGGDVRVTSSTDDSTGYEVLDCSDFTPGGPDDPYAACRVYQGTVSDRIGFVAEPDALHVFVEWSCRDFYGSGDLFDSETRHSLATIRGQAVEFQGNADFVCHALFAPSTAPPVRQFSFEVDTRRRNGTSFDPESTMLPEFEMVTFEVTIFDSFGVAVDPTRDFNITWSWREARGEGGQLRQFKTIDETGPTLRLPVFSDLEVQASVYAAPPGEASVRVGAQVLGLRIGRFGRPPARTILLQNVRPIPAMTYAPGDVVRAGIEVFDEGTSQFVRAATGAWQSSPSLTDKYGALEGRRVTLIANYDTYAPDAFTQVRALGGLDLEPGVMRFEIPQTAGPGNYWLYLDVAATRDPPAGRVEDFSVDATDSVGRLVWSIQVVDG